MKERITKERVIEALNRLKQGKVGKSGIENVQVVKNGLVFRKLERNGVDYRVVEHVLALKLPKGSIIGNSSETIDLLLPIQLELRNQVPMLPFAALKQAGLKVCDTKVVYQGKEETLKEKDITAGEYFLTKSVNNTADIDRLFYRSNTYSNVYESDVSLDSFNSVKVADCFIEIGETSSQIYSNFNASLQCNNNEVIPCEKYHVIKEVHYVGVMIFENQGKYFLVDCDRQELKHYRLNFFMAELPEACTTPEEAYKSLLPEVLQQNSNLSYFRQGEFFFVDTNLPDSAIPEGVQKIDQVRVGSSRPHFVTGGYKTKDNRFFVYGRVMHGGREHDDLILPEGKLYQVVPNRSNKNLTLEGKLD